MKNYFSTLAALALSLVGVFMPAAKADESNKKTNITINRPIEVVDTVLPAGSYVIKRVDLPAERHLIQILNAAENRVMTTVFTVPIERPVAADNSEFKFYEPENGQPPALHSWFYPGDTTGFEFGPGRAVVATESAQSTANTAASTAAGN